MVGSLVLLAVTEGFAFTTTVVLRNAIDSLRPEAVESLSVAWYALLLFGLVIVQGGTRFASRYMMGRSSRYIEYEVRNDFFAHVLTLEPAYYVRQNTGDLISRAINDLNAVRMMLGRTLMFASSSAVRVPVAVVFLLLINWKLMLITLVPFVALPFTMSRMSTRIHAMFESIQEQFATMSKGDVDDRLKDVDTKKKEYITAIDDKLKDYNGNADDELDTKKDKVDDMAAQQVDRATAQINAQRDQAKAAIENQCQVAKTRAAQQAAALKEQVNARAAEMKNQISRAAAQANEMKAYQEYTQKDMYNPYGYFNNSKGTDKKGGKKDDKKKDSKKDDKKKDKKKGTQDKKKK